ncbi:hypothetical protein [Steroidobacter sp.]|uniref:hypothetical protein n=1 Tax=Steroidobacter sp. TaxID=1978227 RepID=UPI001A5E89D2|nr:hypothetical protein [Steroidobacter sp.]MBL8267190.1 hypothetical protein [Steroidobacter sp.]
MNIHTKLVGAFESIILSTTAVVTVVMFLALLDPSFGTFEQTGQHATVTIQQLAMDGTPTARHL